MKQLQLDQLKWKVDVLQPKYGGSRLKAIYGAGCVNNPEILFLFMNPTGKNVSSSPGWKGLRAPWLGTKNIWKLFHAVGILSGDVSDRIQRMRTEEWDEEFSEQLYDEIQNHSAYITNLAKCTQEDARPIKRVVFKAYLENTLDEIALVHPKRIVSFGNEVSSIILGKSVKVSEYEGTAHEILDIQGKEYEVYPTYYPVGQGMRNMGKSIERIRVILK